MTAGSSPGPPPAADQIPLQPGSVLLLCFYPHRSCLTGEDLPVVSDRLRLRFIQIPANFFDLCPSLVCRLLNNMYSA